MEVGEKRLRETATRTCADRRVLKKGEPLNKLLFVISHILIVIVVPRQISRRS